MKKYFDIILISAIIYLLAERGATGAINGLKKSTFLPPYNDAGKTNFTSTQNKSGVYVIKENNKIVYVGYSSNNLYRTMYRHFQKWSHSGQEVVTYHNKQSRNKYTVRVVLCTATQAHKLEAALIRKHEPRDNEQKLKHYQENPEAGKIELQKYEAEEAYPF